jgi:hypothetical protein
MDIDYQVGNVEETVRRSQNAAMKGHGLDTVANKSGILLRASRRDARR